MLLELQCAVRGPCRCSDPKVSSEIPTRTFCIRTAAIPVVSPPLLQDLAVPPDHVWKNIQQKLPSTPGAAGGCAGSTPRAIFASNSQQEAPSSSSLQGVWDVEQGDAGMVLQDFSTLQGGAAATGELQNCSWGNGIWLFQGREAGGAGRSSSPQPNISACFNWIL